MGRHRYGALILGAALAVISFAARADQGPPVYQALVTKPTQGGSCSGNRVQIEFDTGVMWCCGAGGTNLWGKCGATPIGASGTIQASNGTGGLSSYAGAACTPGSNTLVALSATGAPTCAVLSIGNEVNSQVGPNNGVTLISPAATSGSSLMNSPSLTLDGHHWSGTASVADDWGFRSVPTNTAGPYDLSVTFNAVEKANIDNNGTMLIQGDYWTTATGKVQTTQIIAPTGGSYGTPTLVLQGAANAGAVGAINVAIKSLTSLGSDDKIVSFYSNTSTERSYVDGLGNFSANAATATALQTAPAGCTANQYATGIAASGAAVCATVAGSQVSNDFFFNGAPAAALPTCNSAARGQAFLVTPASGADQIHVCLKNSDTTYAWVMFGLGAL
jgi:hypothetical protein